MNHVNQWQTQSNQISWQSQASKTEVNRLSSEHFQKNALIFQRLLGNGNQLSSNATNITHKLANAIQNLSKTLIGQLKGQFSQLNQALINHLLPNHWQQPALAGNISLPASSFPERSNQHGMLSASIGDTGQIAIPASTANPDTKSSDSQNTDVDFQQLLKQEPCHSDDELEKTQGNDGKETAESNIQGLQELVGDMELEGDADFSDLSTWVMNVNNGMMPKAEKD